MTTLTDTTLWTTRKRFKQRLLRVECCDTLPLTLRHERIYILPTGRGLAFVFVAMVMILASMNYGLNLGYALSFIMVGLFASCLLATYLNLAGLQLRSLTSTDTFKGSPLEYSLSLTDSKNKTRYSVSIAAAGSADVIDVVAKQENNAILSIKTIQRGEHKLGRITISSDFPLGLWRGWGYLHTPARSFVYPAPEKLPTPFPASSIEKNNGQARSPERDFHQLKRYQETDSLSTVAWKTVARGGGWYSKEFSSDAVVNDVQLTWSATANLADTEQRLSRLCAWIQRADASATPYTFELNDRATKALLGPDHKRRCLRQLATFGSNLS